MKVYVSRDKYLQMSEEDKLLLKNYFSYSKNSQAWTSRFIDDAILEDYVNTLNHLGLKPVVYFFPTKKQYDAFSESTKDTIRSNFFFNKQVAGWESRPGKEQEAYDVLTVVGAPQCISLNEALKLQLHEAVREINTSEKYFEYLKTMSRFTNYSPNNIMYIVAQNPNASLVAGRVQWAKNGRKINPDAEGLFVLAPNITKQKVDVSQLTDVQKKLYRIPPTAQGEIEVKAITGFRAVKVYDVSETNGKPLPKRPEEAKPKLLKGEVEHFEELKTAIEKTAMPYTVEYVSDLGGANGVCIPSKKEIKVLDNLSQEQTIKTLIHELAHSQLHDVDSEYFVNLPRGAEEVQAESVAFICCRHLGIDSSSYSNGYVASWSFNSQSQTLDLITAAAEHSHKLCSSLDSNYEKIMNERGFSLEQETAQDFDEDFSVENLEVQEFQQKMQMSQTQVPF